MKPFFRLFIAHIWLVMCPSITSMGQSASQTFELSLEGDQMVERTMVLDSCVVLSHVASYIKADYLPNRRYLVVDHQLVLQHDSLIEMSFRKKKAASFVGPNKTYDLFYDYRKGNYSMVSVSATGIEVLEGKFPNKMYEPQLCVTEEATFVLDRRVNRERVYIVGNGKTEGTSTAVTRRKKRTKVFPLYFNTIPQTDQVAYIWRETNAKVDDVHAIIWDNNGERTQQFTISLSKKSIHNINISSIDDDRYMLSGTYSNNCSKMASGVFMSIVEDGATMLEKTYSFSDLPHYFDYLDRYEKEDMKRKLARLKKHEKSTEIRTHAIAHPLLTVEGGYLLTIEFYNEMYSDQYGITRNGNPVVGSPQSLKGYDFSHAEILRFDAFGTLKHDYYVDIELDYLARKNSAKVMTQVIADTLLLGYAAKNDLHVGDIRPTQFIEMNQQDIHQETTQQVIRKEAQLAILPDGRILVYGFKTVRSDKGLNKKADIYFIETRKVR